MWYNITNLKFKEKNIMNKYTVTEWSEYSPSAYVANGFIGLRFAKDPFTGVKALLSGFWGSRRGVEALNPVPAPAIRFSINGEKIKPETVSQTYDFSNGEFETVAKLVSGENEVTVKYLVFCARTLPTIVASRFEFTSEKSCDVRIDYSFEYAKGDDIDIEAVNRNYNAGLYNGTDGKCKIESETENIRSFAGLSFAVSGDIKEKHSSDECSSWVLVTAKPEGTVVTEIISYVPGVMHCEPHNQAQRMVKLAIWNGYDRIRELNTKAWAKLWESRIRIEGANPEWQNVIDASYFYLMSSVSEFAPFSAAPYGLSFDGYEGHTFWDTESFMFMPPLFTAPDIARSMLDYRFERLPAARNNAKLNGYKGIQFPWQSCNSGDEVTIPQVGQAGGAGEQHINLDVALAFDGFARVSGDKNFIRDKAWPIMKGVAEWIESRADKTERGYEILHVTGIDEEADNVSNDAYTNIMSARILRSAAEYSEMTGFGKQEKWLDMADHMYIPTREDGVLLQYEGMKERENLASTTLMAYFPYGYTDTPENDKKTFEFYIDHGMARYLCYPMLSGFLGIFPTWCGNRGKGLYYYEMANLTFFCDPFYACTEWSIGDKEFRKKPTEPLCTSFITGRGSLLSGLIMGLTKMCPWKGDVDADPSEWFGEDIILPDGWDRITIDKIYIRGKAYKLYAENGAKKAVLEPLD